MQTFLFFLVIIGFARSINVKRLFEAARGENSHLSGTQLCGTRWSHVLIEKGWAEATFPRKGIIVFHLLLLRHNSEPFYNSIQMVNIPVVAGGEEIKETLRTE